MSDEFEKARAWRTAHGYTPESLSKVVAYSPEAIRWFEKGVTPPRAVSNGKPKHGKINPVAFNRYKMACAAHHAFLYGWSAGRKFNWQMIVRE